MQSIIGTEAVLTDFGRSGLSRKTLRAGELTDINSALITAGLHHRKYTSVI